MKKIIVITALLIAIFPFTLEAEESELEKEKARVQRLPMDIRSLYGLEGVNVLVESPGADEKQLGLTQSQLQTDIEVKLRTAGIRVFSAEESRETSDGAYLYCNVNIKVDSDGLCAISYELSLNQIVYMNRSEEVTEKMSYYTKVYGITWDTGGVAISGVNNAKSGSREIVKDSIDEFINAFLAANPKAVSVNSQIITSQILTEALKSVDVTKELIGKIENTPLKYTSEEDAFAVSFPSTPQKTILSYKEPMAASVRNYQSVIEEDFVQYNVFCEYLNDKKILNDESQEAYFEGKLTSRLTLSKNTSVIKDKKNSFRGFKAHEYKYTSSYEGVQMTHEGVSFFVDGDSFTLTCVYPSLIPPSPTFEEFVGSFELLPLEPVLQNKFIYDKSAKVKIKAPESFYDNSKKEGKAILEFANKNAHSIQIFDIHSFAPTFKMSDIKNEYPLAKSEPDGDLLNTIHLDKYNINLIQMIRFRKIKGRIYMIQSTSPESTFFRYKKLFKASMDTFSEATRS